jgi:hypothetical protein
MPTRAIVTAMHSSALPAFCSFVFHDDEEVEEEDEAGEMKEEEDEEESATVCKLSLLVCGENCRYRSSDESLFVMPFRRNELYLNA